MTPLVSLVEHVGNTALDAGGWLVAGLGAEKQSKQSREREREGIRHHIMLLFDQ